MICTALVIWAAAGGGAVEGAPPGREARRSFDRGAELENEAAELLRAGDKRAAEARLSEALNAYRMALKKAPSDPDPVLRIGTILLFEERCAEAVPILERSAELAFRIDLSRPGSLSYSRIGGDPKLRELLLLVGKCRLSKGPDDSGFAILEAIRDVEPDVHFLLGRRYLEGGRHRPALTHLSAYLQHNETDLKVRKAVANLQLRLGMLTDAAQTYRDILARDPQDLNALKNLAVVEVRRARYPQAIQTFKRVLHQVPDDVQARFNLGVCLARVGNHQEAVVHLKKALSLKPRLARGWHRLGVSLAAMKKSQRAVAALTKAVRYAPDSVPSYLALAQIYRHDGNANRCAAVLEKILKRSPFEPRILLGLGDCQRDQGLNAQALETHRRAVKIEPRNATIHAALGEDHRSLGRLEDAAAAFRRAIELESGGSDTKVALGKILGELGVRAIKKRDFKLAVTRLTEAVQGGGPDAVNLSNLGVALMSLGKTTEAEPHLKRAYEMNAKHPGIRAALAHLRLSQKRPREAVELLSSPSGRGPSRGPRLRLLGIAYLHASNAGQAAQTLRAALDAMPRGRSVRYELGRALVRARRYRQAANVFGTVESTGLAPNEEKIVRLSAGYAAYRAGDFETATNLVGLAAGRSKVLRSLHAAAWNQLGRSLAAKQQLQLALSAFKAANKVSRTVSSRANVAAIEYELGKSKRAYNTWRRMAKGSVPPQVYHNIAIYLDDEVGNEVAAYRWYRKYARRLPSDQRTSIKALVERKRELFGL